MKTKRRPRVAFVCLGNSCRSQMAEAWARRLGGSRVEALSAGLRPLGFIAGETKAVMAEKGISLDGQHSKGLEAIEWERVDLLVDMSGQRVHRLLEDCPGRFTEWKVEDPFGESLEAHRAVRDLLERKVLRLLADLSAPAQT